MHASFRFARKFRYNEQALNDIEHRRPKANIHAHKPLGLLYAKNTNSSESGKTKKMPKRHQPHRTFFLPPPFFFPPPMTMNSSSCRFFITIFMPPNSALVAACGAAAAAAAFGPISRPTDRPDEEQQKGERRIHVRQRHRGRSAMSRAKNGIVHDICEGAGLIEAGRETEKEKKRERYILSLTERGRDGQGRRVILSVLDASLHTQKECVSSHLLRTLVYIHTCGAHQPGLVHHRGGRSRSRSTQECLLSV